VCKELGKRHNIGTPLEFQLGGWEKYKKPENAFERGKKGGKKAGVQEGIADAGDFERDELSQVR